MEEAILSYQALAVIGMNAELLNELATDANSGEIGEMELPFLLLVMGDFLQGTDNLLSGITPADLLLPFWDDAIASHEAIKDITARWAGMEITAATVLAGLEPVMEDMEATLSNAESALIEEYDLSAEDLAEYSDTAMDLVEFPDQPEDVLRTYQKS